MYLNFVVKVLIVSILVQCSVTVENWPHHAVLDDDGRFHLYWKPPAGKESNSEIVFRVEVAAKGYVLFGLSPRGLMRGEADMVTAWIKHGRVYFQDRHATGSDSPVIDKKQNWKLTYAKENLTHTIFEFGRELDTCDEDDIVIDESTMRVIYGFSNRDPRIGARFDRFKIQGMKSIMLLRYVLPITDDCTLLQWDVLAPSYDISDYESMYWCKIFKSPQLPTKHHIVRTEPIIQEGNEDFVHHMVLYECVDGSPEEYEQLLDNDGYDCFGQYLTNPEGMRKCQGTTIGWAMGGTDILQPDNAGIPLEPVPGKYYMLEIHYDNPQRMHGLHDSSGFRIYYTPHLREYDAAALVVGASYTPNMFFPPRQDSYIVVGHSYPKCLDPMMPEDGIKVYAIMLHNHIRAEASKVRHFRGQKELPPLAVDRYYDFHYQEIRYLEDERCILPGDQLTVECTYNSSTRYTTTFGGRSTQDEMCMAYLLYYPPIERRFVALSGPSVSTINDVLDTEYKDINDLYGLYYYNWTCVNVSEVEDRIRYAKHTSECVIGNGEIEKVEDVISYPCDFEPYVPPPPVCDDDEERPLKHAHDKDRTENRPRRRKHKM